MVDEDVEVRRAVGDLVVAMSGFWQVGQLATEQCSSCEFAYLRAADALEPRVLIEVPRA